MWFTKSDDKNALKIVTHINGNQISYPHTEGRPCIEFKEFSRKKAIRIDFELSRRIPFYIFQKSMFWSPFLDGDQISPSLNPPEY